MAAQDGTTRPWRKLWREERGSFGLLPLMTRAMAGQMLKAADNEGRICVGAMTPADAMARFFGATRGDRAQLKRIMPELEADGFYTLDDGWIQIVNFERFQSDVSASKRARQAPSSSARRAVAAQPPSSDATVTEQSSDGVSAVAVQSSDGGRAVAVQSLSTQVPEIIGPEMTEGEGEGEGDTEGEEENPPTPRAGGVSLPSVEAASPKPQDPRLEAWHRIFAHWQLVTGKTRSKPSPERKRAVMARLKDYPEADIIAAIDGCTSSAFHRAGGHVDLTLICRNSAKLEAFRDGIRSTGPAPVSDWSTGRDLNANADFDAAIAEAGRSGQRRLAMV